MVKNTDIKEELRPLNNLFNTFKYEFDISILFDDFLTIVVCCMAKGTKEGLYLSTIKKYSRTQLDTFSKMFVELVKIYAKNLTFEEWCDPLGEYYEALASKHKKSGFGQFFTPKGLCDLMASLTIDKSKKNLKIYEPCSGSGRNILAADKVVSGNYYVCEDIDPICCKMTAINLCFHNIRGEIHCRDVIAYSAPRFSLAVNYNYIDSKINSIFYYSSNN
ncbi:MAG: hypothetical protein BM557_01295 [Flavobacterium sp. MedPE-SWcel]|uniref:N-6 DNA methylase n=1 Tax=uncultured Flavobacterium sp. TaxID=165435 RepID=UPI0009170241|nr:N-6 DNA methylase [uncultured Flavobacterium sp.]OIQ22042.1 MAG: hypothetical protein BM557_01295 [Flavobacterium sp. MedPE-SWcel]